MPGGWAVDVIWPFFRISKTGSDDAVAAGKGEGWVFTMRLLPLAYIYISQRRMLIAIAPCVIFYKSYDQSGGEGGRTVLHVFPLLSYVSTEKQGERRFFLSVLYIFYYRTIHTPNMHNANSFRVYRAIVLFPIFWHFSEDSSSATTICGVVWLVRMDSHSVFTIFPIFWFVKGNNETTVFFLLFYLTTRRGKLEKLVLFPFVIFSNKDNHTTLSVMLLYWLRVSTNNGHRRVFTTLVPFFFFYRNPEIDKTGFGLFYIVWFTKNPASSSVTMSVLPFFYYRSPQWKPVIGFLLFWMAKHSSGMWWATVFPIFFIKRDGDSTLCWLFPIFFYSASRNKRTIGVLFLFWVISNETKTLSMLLPFGFIYRTKTETRALILQFWYARDTAGGGWSVAVLPFFTFARSAKGATTVSLFLLLWVRSEDDFFLFAFFPFVWVAGSSSTGRWAVGVLPLFTFTRSSSGAKTFSFFLIFWFSIDNDFFLFTLFPFVWVVSSGTAFSFFLVPLFWLYRSKRSSDLFLLLLPFFLFSKGASSLHLSVFPLFHVSQTSNNAFYSLLYLFWWWRYNSKWSVCCIDAFWLN